MYYFLSLFCLVFIFSGSAQAISQPQEIRLGMLRHNIKSGFKQSIEKSYDLNGEYLFASLSGDIWQFLHYPRIHLGASVNLQSGTNQYYTGLTWHGSFIQNTFIEASFGGEIHDGNTKIFTKHKKALGSRLLFRESIAFGFALKNQYTFSILLDHASNARLALPNPGITSIGFRIGYQPQY